MQVQIHHLFISEGHNYVGHHGRPPGTHPIVEVERIRCHAGRGIVGDRYYDHRKSDLGQITFFDYSVFRDALERFRMPRLLPSAFRRNVILEGVDLNGLIGAEFTINGLRLRGTEECRPCYWMDHAVAEGTEEFLEGRGGLRCEILTDGKLDTGPAELRVLSSKLRVDAS